MESESQSSEEIAAGEPMDREPLHASDWLWRPWYAKAWWFAVPVYWGGRMASLKVAALSNYYETLVAGYLAVVCNPFIVVLLLGFGFIRAKLDRGDWIITPNVPVWTQRKPGEVLDPYTDPSDPRSGPRHLRHIGVLRDGGH